MEKFWSVGIPIFIVTTLVVWRTTRNYFKRETGSAMWKNWTAQTYYWQSAIYLSTGITILILVVLKWSNILTF